MSQPGTAPRSSSSPSSSPLSRSYGNVSTALRSMQDAARSLRSAADHESAAGNGRQGLLMEAAGQLDVIMGSLAAAYGSSIHEMAADREGTPLDVAAASLPIGEVLPPKDDPEKGLPLHLPPDLSTFKLPPKDDPEKDLVTHVPPPFLSPKNPRD